MNKKAEGLVGSKSMFTVLIIAVSILLGTLLILNWQSVLDALAETAFGNLIGF